MQSDRGGSVQLQKNTGLKHRQRNLLYRNRQFTIVGRNAALQDLQVCCVAIPCRSRRESLNRKLTNAKNQGVISSVRVGADRAFFSVEQQSRSQAGLCN